MSATHRQTQPSRGLIRALLGGLALLLLTAAGCGPMYVQPQNDAYYRGAPAPQPTQPAYTQPVAPAAAPATTVAQDDPSAYFSDLSRYGRWLYLAGYGRVWFPRANRTPGWRPYYLGYWENTAYGWTWVSNESWGWGPYHYGRWFWSNQLRGWAWQPGYEWAPAWVTWRTGGGCVGWAPMGPRNVRVNHYSYWIFVRHNSFYRQRVNTVVVQPAVASRIYTQTVVLGHRGSVRTRGGTVVTYNRGPRTRTVQTWTRKPVTARKISAIPSARPRNVPTPRTRRPAPGARPAKPRVDTGTRPRPGTSARPGPGASMGGTPGARPTPGTRPAPTARPAPGTRPAPTYRPPPGTRPAPTYRPAPGTRPAPTYRPGTRPAPGVRPAPTY
ncbi:MAG: hypothetical protein KC502_08125, partial [Myxococcales bacterium]|nr:hypothetical protein [Myxococcales bacterium]